MIQYLVALLLAAGTAWLISAGASGALDRAISAFGELAGGWRPDGWPLGVQEEDRDRPWGGRTTAPSTPALSASVEPTAYAVATVPLHPRTRRR